MKIQFSDLWRWDGTVERGKYALIGVAGFAIKHNLDRFVATVIFHRKWGIFNYWIPPAKAVRFSELSRDDAAFLATMVLLSLPFIWAGVALTLRRLRDAGLPPWLVVAFFLPVLNLVFFLLLSVLPSRPSEFALRPPRPEKAFLDRLIPDSPAGSAALAILVTLCLGVAVTLLDLSLVGKYGWGLFVGLPFCLGMLSVLIFGYHRSRSFGKCLVVSFLSVVLVGAALLALAVEGVVCLFMAAPIAIVLASIGGAIGYLIQRRPGAQAQFASLTIFLVLLTPVMVGAESVIPLEPPLFVVRTVMEIDAPPAEVWSHLVSFPELPKPAEWLFRAGIAYPIEASIRGRGSGAMRECLFSTGTFVEVIEAWDDARLLRFSVAVNAPPMRELTPYPEIHPPHLDGYLLPRRAEFRLTALPGGRTRLEGTSWYRNEMWPADYWKLWSDWIIHSVHLRVFGHIKRLSEQRSHAKLPAHEPLGERVPFSGDRPHGPSEGVLDR